VSRPHTDRTCPHVDRPVHGNGQCASCYNSTEETKRIKREWWHAKKYEYGYAIPATPERELVAV
jgi:hypothetical protein